MIDTLSEQEKKELSYISLILMISSDEVFGTCSVKNSIVPEMVYVLNTESFIGLMKHFPGQWIRIPSVSEMKRALDVIAYYYHTEVKGEVKKDVLHKLHLLEKDKRLITPRINNLKKFFKDSNFKIPDSMCTTDFMKKLQKQLCITK